MFTTKEGRKALNKIKADVQEYMGKRSNYPSELEQQRDVRWLFMGIMDELDGLDWDMPDGTHFPINDFGVRDGGLLDV
jgi:lysozyme family protein